MRGLGTVFFWSICHSVVLYCRAEGLAVLNWVLGAFGGFGVLNPDLDDIDGLGVLRNISLEVDIKLGFCVVFCM